MNQGQQRDLQLEGFTNPKRLVVVLLGFHRVGEGEDLGCSVDLHKANVPQVALKGDKLLGEGQKAVNGLVGVLGVKGESEGIQEFLPAEEELTLLLKPLCQLSA